MYRFLGWLFSVVIIITLAAPSPAMNAGPETPARTGERDQLVEEIAPGKRLYGKKPEFAEIGHTNNFDLSPDGKKIAFMSHQGIRYWDIEKGKLEEVEEQSGQPRHDAPGQFFEYSADGLKLFSSTWSTQSVPVPKSDDEEDDETDEDQAQSVQFVAQGQVIEVRNAVTGEIISQIRPVVDKDNPNRHLSLMLPSPDGDKVLLGLGQQSEIYDTATGEMIHRLKHKSWVQSAVFDNDGKRLIEGNGKIIDIDTGETVGQLPRLVFGQNLNSMKFHPKRNMIAASEWSKGVILYDLEKKKRVDLQVAKSVQQQHMYHLEFSGDGELLASATYANWQTGKGKPTIVVWNVDSGKIIDEIQYGGGHLARIRISPDNRYIYVKSNSQYGISRYEIDGKRTQSESAPVIASPIQRFQFIDSDQKIIASPQLGSAVVFDIETGEATGSVSIQNTAHLEMTQSGKYAVIAANYRNVKIHNVETGNSKTIQVKSFSRPSVVSQLGSFLTGKKEKNQYENFAIGAVSVTEDDKYILIALRGGQSFVWQKFRIDNGENIQQRRFKFSDYWETETAADGQRQTFNQYHWVPGATTISPDGRRAAMVGPENTVYVMDAESGDEEFDFKIGSFQHGSAMFFSRNSQKLHVKQRTMLQTYDLESGESLSQFDFGSDSHQFGLSGDRTKIAIIKSIPNEVVIYDLDSDGQLFSSKLQQHYTGIGVSDDGKKLALARPTCQFEIWDLNQVE